MNDLSFELSLPPLFSFKACLAHMARSPLECLYATDKDGVNLLLKLGNCERLIRLTCPRERMMRVQLLQGDPLDKKERDELSRYIRDWFDLDRDLQPFYSMSAGDPLLGPLTESFFGLRLVGIPNLFVALCWAIVGQQVNLTFAYKLKRRLTEEYGNSITWEGLTYRRFPSPERLAVVPIEELCSLQLSTNKARALLETAALLAGGELSREKLMALDSAASVDKVLTGIRGIGPWTSQYVRMKCLRDRTAFPVGDVGLHNAVKRLLRLDRKPTLPELKSLFAEWQGWEAYAVFYLWRSLDAPLA